MIEPSHYEEEHMVKVSAGNTDYRVVSGYANFVGQDPDQHGGPTPSGDAPRGDVDSDTVWVQHTVHLFVGPEWQEVREVSPVVDIAGYAFDDSDEADDSGYHIDSCAWEAVDVPASQPPARRIRLEVKLRVRGGPGFGITKLSYQVAAMGLI